MTTKPTYQIISVIDYASLEYDPNELEPIPTVWNKARLF